MDSILAQEDVGTEVSPGVDDQAKNANLKVVVAAVLAFVSPVAIWYGSAVVLTGTRDSFWRAIDPDGHSSTSAYGSGVWFFLGLAAPFLGYAFLARPFGRWEDLERGTLLLVVSLTVMYWTIYGLMLCHWLEILFLGFGGGI